MTKLSMTQAAKQAGIAKSTLLEALRDGRVSGSKNDKGNWEIDVSELHRVYPPKTSSTEQEEPRPTEHKKPTIGSENRALEVEVKMLREQIDLIKETSDRERHQMEGQITNLQEQLERQSADHRQALAVLQDQRPKAEEEPKGLIKRIFG